MAVEDDDDRAVFFEADDFAVTATFRDSEGFAKTGEFTESLVEGIFENAYVDVGGVESRRPTFLCRAIDIPDFKHEDELVIDGTTYTIVESQPDGTGMVNLILEKQPE